jgi:Caspase domain
MPAFDQSSSFAILFGVANYQNSRAYESMSWITNNLAELRAILIDKDLVGFRDHDDHVLVKIDPTYGQLGEDLEELRTKHLNIDTLLVYYCGHGVVQGGKYYLTGTNSSESVAGKLLFDTFEDIFLSIRAKRKLLVLDSCFSGRAVRHLSDLSSILEVNVDRLGEREKKSSEIDNTREGTYVIASADREKPSPSTDGTGELTAFTSLLVNRVKNGLERQAEERLTIGELVDAITTEASLKGLPKPSTSDKSGLGSWRLVGNAFVLKKKFEAKLEQIQARVSAPRQVGVELTTTLDPLHLPDDDTDGRLAVVVVCRETGSETLVTVTERALILDRSKLEAQSGKSIAESPECINDNVFRLDVAKGFSSRASMIKCLHAMCRADIAIFDVTGEGPGGIEPGIMLLLGVRAVVRRGVSICSVDHDPEQLFEVQLPYNLQQLNIASHRGKFDELDAAERLAQKMANGLHEVDFDLTYLDLPAFDAIRNLGGDISDYEPIPYYRGPLHLGPFNQVFQDECFRKLEPEITIRLDAVAKKKDGRDYKRPQVFRLLDYDRARMVSQSLYHSIRRHDFCLIDWTWLRPNVFFEFGVRLASRQSGDVHIVANVERKDARVNGFSLSWPTYPGSTTTGPDPTSLTHVKDLRQIFAPIEYKPQSKDSIRNGCAAILNQWKATRELRYENALFFETIARSSKPPAKGAVETIVELLRKRASTTHLYDQDTLLSTLLYEEHDSTLQKAAIGQSIALKLAGLFLRVSSRIPPEDGPLPGEEIEVLAQEIRRFGRRVGTDRDVAMLNGCLDAIRQRFA